MRAAAYARYSTDKQTENSIEYQLAEIRRYCAAHEIPVTATYSDEAYSGTNADRPGFQAMVAAAKAGVIDAVIVYDISRGSRDVADWFAFRKDMLRLGVQVISATGQKIGDLTNSQDFLLELLTVGMGQAEVLNTRQKSLDGVAVKAKQGAFLGGIPPLGYDIVGEAYVINPTEAAVVRKIFRMYAEGRSYAYIIDHLDGAVGKRGRPLGKNSLNSILTNERYVGTYTWNKYRTKLFRKWAGGGLNPDVIRIENAIPPIVDRETWRRVRARMSDNTKNAKNKARHSYLLSGLIECEACGAAYVGHSSTNKRGYTTRYYCCGNKYRTRSCQSKNINADEIETFVVEQLKAYLQTLDYTETARIIAEQVNGASADLAAEREELVNVSSQIQNGMKALLRGMEFPELEDEIGRLRVRKSELEDIIAQRQSEHPTVDAEALAVMLRESAANLDAEHMPELIRKYIQKIYATSDGSYSVEVGVHLNGCGGAVYIVCATIRRVLH